MIRFTPEAFAAHQKRLATLKETANKPPKQPHQGTNGGKAVPKDRSATEGAQGAGKRSKHGAVKTVSDDGKFDSKLEVRCWQELKLRQSVGEIKGLRRQVRFSLFAPGGEHLGTYKADFVYYEWGVIGGGAYYTLAPIDWTRVVADAKSAHTRKLPGWNRTKTLMMACHGITVLELP